MLGGRTFLLQWFSCAVVLISRGALRFIAVYYSVSLVYRWHPHRRVPFHRWPLLTGHSLICIYIQLIHTYQHKQAPGEIGTYAICLVSVTGVKKRYRCEHTLFNYVLGSGVYGVSVACVVIAVWTFLYEILDLVEALCDWLYTKCEIDRRHSTIRVISRGYSFNIWICIY